MNPVDASIPKSRRTAMMWVISVLYSVVPLLTAVGMVAMHFGAFPSVTESDPYFKSLGLADLTMGLAVTVAEVLGASLLWLFRRQAFHWFIVATILGVVNFWWHSLIRGWVGAIDRMAPAMTVPTVVSALVGPLLLVAVSAYTWRLTKAGVLK